VTRRSEDRPFLEPFASLLGEAHGSVRTFEVGPGSLDLADQVELARPVRGRGRATRTNRGLLVEIDADTAIATACSRCLDEIVVALSFHVEEEVLPSLDLATGASVDVSAEPEATRLDDHHQLDLEPILGDAIVMAEPIAPLCQPDCPGLCPVCGARLKDDPGHRHDDDEIDPRLAALKAFTVDAPDENG
jgi:uncharacterized metal-binding protein YceD (DUF177 family)